MHQMADRAVIALGTPMPPPWQTQPYSASNPDANRHLSRRPIAMVTLSSGNYDSNYFGQASPWRSERGNSATADVQSLRNSIRQALNGCDQFEILFNRPGGGYDQDVVMSYVFGEVVDPETGALTRVITDNQWAAMGGLWDYFNLSHYNDDQDLRPSADGALYRRRRAWFYVGAGLPLNDDGTLNETGLMGDRQVAPATPGIYKTAILDHWPASDTGTPPNDERYKCLILDAGVQFYAKLVELVHDSEVNENFTIVGEAIPTEIEGRKGAPWFGMTGIRTGPWWNLNDDGQLDSLFGYNFNWINDWVTQPLYFGVQLGQMQNLTGVGTKEQKEGNGGNDLPIGVIYTWIRKGAIPVAWSTGAFQKVGAAWNYATGRVLPSRQVRCPRLMRSARV